MWATATKLAATEVVEGHPAGTVDLDQGIQGIWSGRKAIKPTKHCKTSKGFFNETFIKRLLVYNICNEKDNDKGGIESGIANRRLTKCSVGNVDSARNVVGSNSVGGVGKT